MQYNLNL